jgi:hypothetical protein|tara:strand:- start:177 stop:494 length:318 start_codon:yes stop_codon:yes gene_type:complete
MTPVFSRVPHRRDEVCGTKKGDNVVFFANKQPIFKDFLTVSTKKNEEKPPIRLVFVSNIPIKAATLPNPFLLSSLTSSQFASVRSRHRWINEPPQTLKTTVALLI